MAESTENKEKRPAVPPISRKETKPIAGRAASPKKESAPVTTPPPIRRKRVPMVRANSMIEGSLVYPTRVRAVRTSVRNGKLFSLAMLLVSIFLIYWFLADPRFVVTSVDVTGTSGSRVNDVQQAAGGVGQNIFMMHSDDVQGRVATLGFVDQVRVQERWPARMIVTITERQPDAIWQLEAGGAQFLVDRNGLLIDHPRGGETLQVIHDVDNKDFKIGDHIDADAVATTHLLYASLTAQSGMLIAKIEYHRDCGIEVISSTGQRVCFGSSAQMDQKIADIKILVGQKRPFNYANVTTPDSIVIK